MTSGRNRAAVVFTAPSAIEIRREMFEPPGPGQAVVHTLQTAISAGTELLIYRGRAPEGLPADSTLPALAGELAFPLKYGYSAVGRIVELGADVDRSWLGRSVFAFQPHQTIFVANVAELVPLPASLGPDQAVFLSNMETAIGLVHDGRPLAGERVVVLGQGIVGLLTTAVLGRMRLARLVTLDRIPMRREASIRLGAHLALDPSADGAEGLLRSALSSEADHPGADLTYELSGDPAVLDQAITVTGDDGRIVIGSWYGRRSAPVDLGGRFHRSRIRLISSQVSTIAPDLSGRWSKARRLDFALGLLAEIQPGSLITHRFPFDRAPDAFRLLDQSPGDALQVVLTYPEP